MSKQNYGVHNNSSVYVTKKITVYQKTSHPEKVLILSSLDRQCPLLMYLVFFYKQEKASNFSLGSVFSNLKTGLEKTLSVWYPAAGRLSFDPKDQGKLKLWCNNGGAVMVEAVTRVNISELGDLSEYNEFFETLVYKPAFSKDFSEMPLVVAQVTRFACGGYSIGIGISHSLFDGPSAYDFLNAWASNCNIKGTDTNNYNNNNEPDIKPVHEREGLLSATKPNRNQNPNREAKTRAAAIDHLYLLLKQAMTDQIMNGADLDGDNGNFDTMNTSFVLKTFELSGEAIEGLKKKTIGGTESPQGFSCSSFEFLAAHLWKARTKALGLGKEAMVCLQFPVDIRKKVNPPLQKEFSGNAYVLASVASTAAEVEELTLETLIHKIKQAKKSINQDYVSAYIEALDNKDQNDSNLPPIKELTLVSDWTRMSFHMAGFVNGEPADCVSPLFPPVPQVAYFMQSPKDFEGVRVRIGLLPHSLEDFSNYFLNGLV